jgi:hypothetical protein
MAGAANSLTRPTRWARSHAGHHDRSARGGATATSGSADEVSWGWRRELKQITGHAPGNNSLEGGVEKRRGGRNAQRHDDILIGGEKLVAAGDGSNSSLQLRKRI